MHDNYLSFQSRNGKRRILIVEDEPLNRDILGSILEDEYELLFAGMGVTGVAVYQFLENCAIYYTNASNVAILVSFGPVVGTLFAALFLGERITVACAGGGQMIVAGVAIANIRCNRPAVAGGCYCRQHSRRQPAQ